MCCVALCCASGLRGINCPIYCRTFSTVRCPIRFLTSSKCQWNAEASVSPRHFRQVQNGSAWFWDNANPCWDECTKCAKLDSALTFAGRGVRFGIHHMGFIVKKTQVFPGICTLLCPGRIQRNFSQKSNSSILKDKQTQIQKNIPQHKAFLICFVNHFFLTVYSQ